MRGLWPAGSYHYLRGIGSTILTATLGSLYEVKIVVQTRSTFVDPGGSLNVTISTIQGDKRTLLNEFKSVRKLSELELCLRSFIVQQTQLANAMCKALGVI